MTPLRFLPLLFAATLIHAQPAPVPLGPNNVSLRKEVDASIQRGLAWMLKAQKAEGNWSSPDLPALTALPLTVLLSAPKSSAVPSGDPAMEKAFSYLFSMQKADGGFYKTQEFFANYNTSITMMALLAAQKPEYRDRLLKARAFVVTQQNDFKKPGSTYPSIDGGIGYGDDEPHADLSNTVHALEALRATRSLAADSKTPTGKDLDWNAAIRFVEKCQNLPGGNKESWVSGDPANIGGFIYFPGFSEAGEMTLPNGKKALRSYGSMSYAGLLSFIYADVKKDDPRVQAAWQWLQRNYTLDENPGMGSEGLYYYYHMVAKSLSAYGAPELTLADGKTVNWREDLAKKLLNLQKTDGHWINDDKARWMEQDPVLVTSYALLALELLEPKL